MAKISALIHAENDARRIGRVLESLRACDEVVVVDHDSSDETRKIAREHGATIKKGIPGVEPGAYAFDLRHDWVLCLLPNEAIGESLEASLLDWKQTEHEEAAFCFSIREEDANGWRDLPPEPRLANRTRVNWTGKLPAANCDAAPMPGEILRFSTP
jgi:glycosyltransferase involved in cell wall biosynthesis